MKIKRPPPSPTLSLIPPVYFGPKSNEGWGVKQKDQSIIHKRLKKKSVEKKSVEKKKSVESCCRLKFRSAEILVG